MSFTTKFGDKPAERAGFNEFNEVDAQDLELEQALKNFRLSVHAWSDAEYGRVRSTAKIVPHRSWRPALGWALGCAVVAGGFSGGLYQRHQRQEQAKIAAAHAEHERQVALERQARIEEENFLADVDSDISREVPSAMEPLAQLMTEDGAE